jgi:uncharacterized protein with HEPN domain
MQPKSIKLLADIRDAAEFIRAITADKTLEHYRGDRILRQAVERNFEILGEAMLRLTRHDPETANKVDSYQQIIAFRNILIHGYDLVDDALDCRNVSQPFCCRINSSAEEGVRWDCPYMYSVRKTATMTRTKSPNAMLGTTAISAASVTRSLATWTRGGSQR